MPAASNRSKPAVGRRARWLLAALLGASTGLSFTNVAHAQADAETRARARQHYERAKELVNAESFEEAAEEFRKAYEIAPHFEVLYNLGQAYVALGRPVEAVEALSRYLAEGGERIAKPRRADVEQEIERQRGNIGELMLELEPATATVAIDGVSLAEQEPGKPKLLASGRHVVSATAAGYRPVVLPVQVVKAERRTVALRLERLEEPAPQALAQLAVTCSVPDVALWVDGQQLAGSSASEVVSVVPGSHRISFRRDGYATSEQQLELSAGPLRSLDCGVAPLSPLPLSATLVIQVSEEAAIVEVDGQPLPPTGLVPVGRHRIEVRRSGFRTARFELVAPAGSTIRRDVRLLPTQQFAADYRAQARRQRLLALAVAGVGVATGGVGIALYVDNDNRFETWQAKQRELDRAWAKAAGTPGAAALELPQSANDELGRQVQTRDKLALGLGIAGGALVGVAAGLWIFGDNPERYGNLTWSAGREHAAIDWAWTW